MAFDFSQFTAGAQPSGTPAATTPPPLASSAAPTQSIMDSSPLSKQQDNNLTNEESYLQNGVNQGNQGWSQALTNVTDQQKQYEKLINDPNSKQYLDQINAVSQADPSAFEKTVTTRDTDGNVVQDNAANSAYDPKLTAARDWLTQNNMLNYTPADTGEANTAGHFSAGTMSPLGSDVWSKTGATGISDIKNGGWLVPTPIAGTEHGLINSSQVGNDPLWGKITNEANIKDTSNQFLNKYGPMVAMAIATVMSGGAGAAMFGGLDAAGGATAGALAGDATATGAFGGAEAATAGSALADSGSWLTQALPNLVKSGITTLGNGGDLKSGLLGAAEGLGGAALGASGIMPDVPSYTMPLVNAALGIAKGGSFDFSKFIGPAIGLASKIGK